MRRLQPEHYLLAFFGLAIFVLALLWYQNEQEIRVLQEREARVDVPVVDEAKAEVALQASNPHVEAMGAIEVDAGMRLSRIAKIIIRDEGDRSRPYADTGGAPIIGVGRNLRDNGVSVSELKAIVKEIDYDVVLRETHVKEGRVRIDSIDLANRIFNKPLTEHDIQLLLTDDLNSVRRDAVVVFGDAVWGSIEEPRKEAILDVVFNLGLPRFKKFVNFIEAVKDSDWDRAATELLKSEAALENPERYFRNYRVVRTGNENYFEL